MTVTGDKELLREMERMRKAVRSKTRSATRKAASYGSKSVKAKISNPSVRKAVGWRLLKANESGGEITAKIGAAVGKKKKRATSTKSRAGRGGVGIDHRNVHWWFLGTAERFTGTTRVGGHRTGNTKRKFTGKTVRRTGRMPAQDRPISVLIDNAGTAQVLRTYLSQNVVKK